MRFLAPFVLVLAAACGGGSSTPAATATPPAGDQPEAAESGGAMRITGVEPRSVDAGGGTQVTIHGENFNSTSAVKVFFGSVQADVVRVSAGEIIVTAPGGTAGNAVDLLVVFEPGGELTLPGAISFTPGS